MLWNSARLSPSGVRLESSQAIATKWGIPGENSRWKAEVKTGPKQRRRRPPLIIDHYARRGRVIGIYVLRDNPRVTRRREGEGRRTRAAKVRLNAPWVSFNCYLRETITLSSASRKVAAVRNKWTGERQTDRQIVTLMRRRRRRRREKEGNSRLIYRTNSRQLSSGRHSSANHAHL